MQFTTETITPEKAMRYLQTNTKNRPVSKVFVRSYAETMRKGRWMLNGVPIVFDNDGRLIDGQHRLHAVIEAGIPVEFSVARGASPDAFTTYDCGRHRNLGQLIAIQGAKNYTQIASIVASNKVLVENGRLISNAHAVGRSFTKTTNDEYYKIYVADAAEYERVASIIKELSAGRTRILTGSWAGGMYYYLTHTGGYSEECVRAFFEDLYFKTNNSDVVMKLRDMLQKAAMSGRKYTAEMLWALLAKTWNCYIKGECPRALVYKTDLEVLPRLITKQQILDL